MIELVGENDEVVVFADVGEFEIAGLALDVQVAFVPIVETIEFLRHRVFLNLTGS